MNVEIISATDDPEELVCTCARNDYRSDGVIGHSFAEIMADFDPDPDIVGEAFDEMGYSREAFGNRDDVDSGSVEDNIDVIDDNGPMMLEARKRSLLNTLMKSGHWGPFEHPQATVAIEGVTRVLTHQIVRHRHFTFDQQSLRYVSVDGGMDDPDDDSDRDGLGEQFQYPPFIGTGTVVDREGVHEIDDEYVENYYSAGYGWAAYAYEQLLEEDVPREQARKVLPMGTKTNIVVSGNARAWMHILNVRTKGDVQGETRRCAEAIFQALKEWMPYTFEKYDEDVLPLKLNP